MINILNTHDLADSIFEHVSPHVSFSHVAGDESVIGEGKAELLRQWEAVLENNPDLGTNLFDIQAKVNEVTGRAKVWTTRAAYGFPDGLQREATSEFIWERTDGSWNLVKYRSLRLFPWGDDPTS